MGISIVFLLIIILVILGVVGLIIALVISGRNQTKSAHPMNKRQIDQDEKEGL